MSHHETSFTGSIPDAITEAIRARMPDAVVEVAGGGGHYRIAVVSTAFDGKGLLDRQRLVLSSIKHLLAGNQPPVHAVDALETRTP